MDDPLLLGVRNQDGLMHLDAVVPGLRTIRSLGARRPLCSVGGDAVHALDEPLMHPVEPAGKRRDAHEGD